MEPPAELWTESHRRIVLDWLRAHTRGDDRCEDWTQEALLRAWRLRDRFDGDAPSARPVAWLVAVASYVLREGRHKDARPESLERFLDGVEDEWQPVPEALVAPAREQPEFALLVNELRHAVWNVLRAMTPRQRAELWWAHGDGQVRAGRAGADGKLPDAVRWRLHNHRRAFRRRWQEERNTA